MLELEDALRRILDQIEPLPAEHIPVSASWGRVSAEDVHSPIDLPRFDNSAMDGYAVQANDVLSAGPDSPVALKLTGQVSAGEVLQQPVQSGQCVRIFTGSALPAGADAVVMQEDVKVDPSDAQRVQFFERASPWENVRLHGEDVKTGSLLISSGDRLSAGKIGLLSAAGRSELSVTRQPTIAVLTTGSELVEPGNKLPPGKIYESNRTMIASLAANSGAVPKVFPLVPDSLSATREALTEAFEQCDGVVTSGGVSVGDWDLVKQAMEELGGELNFWKVAIKPGKPFVFGRRQGKLWFGLPGNPVSALVTFVLLVRPALWQWQGLFQAKVPGSQCPLAESLRNPGGRRHFVRVRFDDNGEVRSAGVQASHMLGSLASADGLVDVPPKTTLPMGTLVRVLPIS